MTRHSPRLSNPIYTSLRPHRSEADTQLKRASHRRKHCIMCSPNDRVKSILSHLFVHFFVFPTQLHTVNKTQLTKMRLLAATTFLLTACKAHNHTSRILSAANADHIDLNSIPLLAEALTSIQAIYDITNTTIPNGIAEGSIVDVHAHVVPPWYRTLVPSTGQSPTPAWSLETHLNFMVGAGIKYGFLSIGTPGSVVFPGSQVKSAALARLLNEYLAAVNGTIPEDADCQRTDAV